MRSMAREPEGSRQTGTATVPGRVPPRAGPGRALRRALGNQATTRLASSDEVPLTVRQVLSSPGQPLEPATRRLMEPHFRHDLGDVRVHHGPLAAKSVADVDALAYTVGRDIVFGAGQYLPGTEAGRSLLAHELTHVVQQRNVVPGTPIRMGNPADTAERHAGALDSQPTLRRAVAPVKTWAGTFTADPYNAYRRREAGGVVGYGADIAITFTPNSLVDAEQISFVQTALSIKDGKPYNKYDAGGKETETALRRSIPAGQPGEGVHVDQFPISQTPLYAPATPGWRHRDPSGVVKAMNATMHDDPDLNTGDIWTEVSAVQTGEWGQRFETTALATAGNQKGTYYGSVRWGWTKDKGDLNPRLLKFEAASQDVPSPIFMTAAGLWNVTPTSEGKQPDDLPVAETRRTTSRVTQLWGGPNLTGKVATLAKGTLLQRKNVEPMSFTSVGLLLLSPVTVLSGPHTGQVGWVWNSDLAKKP